MRWTSHRSLAFKISTSHRCSIETEILIPKHHYCGVPRRPAGRSSGRGAADWRGLIRRSRACRPWLEWKKTKIVRDSGTPGFYSCTFFEGLPPNFGNSLQFQKPFDFWLMRLIFFFKKTPFTRYNRLSKRLTNRLHRVNKHSTGFQTVVRPVLEPVVSYKRSSTGCI